MRSDIIYKIGTAEFRRRYIDPAVKSGKIDYNYKIRYGAQAFRERCVDIILGDNVPDTPDIPDAPAIVWPDLITDPYPFNDSVIQFKFSKEGVELDNMAPNQTDNTIRLKNLSFTEEDKEFSFEVAVNTNRLYTNSSNVYWIIFTLVYAFHNPSCIDFINGDVKAYSNGKLIEDLETTSKGIARTPLGSDKYEGIIEIKGKFPVVKAGTQYETYIPITLNTDLNNKNT